MEKRFQAIQNGVIVSAIIVLTPTEQEKLECKDLENAINEMANKLNVKWAVEINGNVATATISRQYGPVVGDAQSHEIEMAANNFMRGIEHLSLPCEDKKCLDEDLSEDMSDVVITFDAGGNGARIIKALREHMGLTVHAAQMRTLRGRIVCNRKDASLIMDNLDVAGAKNVNIDSKLTQYLDFCNSILKDWDETEDMPGVMGARIMYGVKACPGVRFMGEEIPGDMLEYMLIAYANYYL